MKKVQLTQGQQALVDDSDFERVSQHRWHATWNYNGFYAQRTLRGVSEDGKRIIQPMAKFILQTNQMVDHRDGNRLNNTRANLRIATPLENSRNRPVFRNNKAGFKGVFPTRGTKANWSAVIYVNKKQIYLGSFKTKEDAARAYDSKAVEAFGEFARLNFPAESLA